MDHDISRDWFQLLCLMGGIEKQTETDISILCYGESHQNIKFIQRNLIRHLTNLNLLLAVDYTEPVTDCLQPSK